MTRRRIPAVFAAVVTFAFVLACEGTVQGERALSGTCPEGETCSDDVYGLAFQGQVLYDEVEDRLGPVLVGGKFDLSFWPLGGVIDSFDVELDGRGLDVESLGVAEMTLVGQRAGDTVIRVIDPDTGELYDQLTIRTVEIEDVELHNVSDPARTELIGGCEEMIGVRLVADGGNLRAFDQDVTVRAEGQVTPDPLVWDCFRYVVPADADSVSFEVTAGGETFVREMPVVDQQDGYSCPVLSD